MQEAIPKYHSPDALAILCRQLGCQGRKLVFTNGCFDLLHVGHVRHLQEARSLGDALLVAVNSDRSVRQLKGEKRPILQEAHRAEILAALACVNFVTIFNELDVSTLIRAIKPHIYVKGKDYTLQTMNQDERAALEEAQSEIHFLAPIPGQSTSSILEKIESHSLPN